jgi:hypothetical protein
MRTRTISRAVLAGACCAGLAACTAASSAGPINTVTPPAVGRPAAPDSVETALARMPIFPYTILGQSDNDALAPGESSTALGAACVAAAGYPGTQNMLGFMVRMGAAGLGFSQDWGPWGYLGATDAEQYGFRPEPGKGLQELGIGTPDPSGQAGLTTLPTAEQNALDKCDTIKANFLDAMFSGPLAGISAMAADVTTDLQANEAIKTATAAWSACMATNGYHYATPQAAQSAQFNAMYGSGQSINGAQAVSPAVNAAQIAAAVTDSDCTASSDLAGIYFAVEASYEQQVVSANQTALAAAVQGFRSHYEKELSDMPSLLATTKANSVPVPGVEASPGVTVSSGGRATG